MVTLLKNSFTGQTLGPATTGNSGASGSAFSHMVAAGNGSFSYVNMPLTGNSGNTGLRVTFDTANGLSYPRHTTAGTDGRRVVARRIFKFNKSALPTQDLIYIDIRTEVSATAGIANIHMRTTGELEVTTSAGIAGSRFAMPAGSATYQVELAATVASATGANDAQVGYRLYAEDGTTLLKEWNSAANLDRTASLPNIVRWCGTTYNSGKTFDEMDELQALFTSDTSAWLGPYSETYTLDTPAVTVTGTTTPTTVGGTNGTIALSWARLTDPNVASYEVSVAPGFGALSGFTVKGTVAQPGSGGTVTSTITGLSAGEYTVSVRAMP